MSERSSKRHKEIEKRIDQGLKVQRDDSEMITFEKFKAFMSEERQKEVVAEGLREGVAKVLDLKLKEAEELLLDLDDDSKIEDAIDKASDYIRSKSKVLAILEGEKATSPSEEEAARQTSNLKDFANWLVSTKKLIQDPFDVSSIDHAHNLLIHGYNNISIPEAFDEARFQRLAEVIRHTFEGISVLTVEELSDEHVISMLSLVNVLGPTSSNEKFAKHFERKVDLLNYADNITRLGSSYIEHLDSESDGFSRIELCLKLASASKAQIKVNCEGNKHLGDLVYELHNCHAYMLDTLVLAPQTLKVERDLWMTLDRLNRTNTEAALIIAEKSFTKGRDAQSLNLREKLINELEGNDLILLILPGTPEALLNIALAHKENKDFMEKVVKYADQVIRFAKIAAERYGVTEGSEVDKYMKRVDELRLELPLPDTSISGSIERLVERNRDDRRFLGEPSF